MVVLLLYFQYVAYLVVVDMPNHASVGRLYLGQLLQITGSLSKGRSICL